MDETAGIGYRSMGSAFRSRSTTGYASRGFASVIGILDAIYGTGSVPTFYSGSCSAPTYNGGSPSRSATKYRGIFTDYRKKTETSGDA